MNERNSKEDAPRGDDSGDAPRRRFRRSQRLTLAREFAAAYHAKIRKPAGPLMVHAVANGLDRSRLGLSIGRSVGGAVVRNRLKRMLREAFRLEQHNLPAGLDLVISARAHRRLTLDDYRQMLVRAVDSLKGEISRREKHAQPAAPDKEGVARTEQQPAPRPDAEGRSA